MHRFFVFYGEHPLQEYQLVDKGFLSACILLGLIAAGLIYHVAKSRLPGMVMPFASLPKAEQQKVAKQKLSLRCAALAFFILAAVLLFTGMPRGSTVLAAVLGFICQYNVFCLRRKYPAGDPRLMARPEDIPPSNSDSE